MKNKKEEVIYSQRKVLTFLRRHIAPKFNFGVTRDFSITDLFTTAVTLCCENGFAEGICKRLNRLSKFPSADTFIRAVKRRTTEQLLASFDKANGTIAKIARRQGLMRSPVPVAIDWYDNMFYGDKDTPFVIGTQHKNGSNYAFRYLTASALKDGERHIIAVLPLQKAGQIEVSLELLLKRAMQIIDIDYVLLDAGFYSKAVIRLFEKMGIRYLMHLPATKSIVKKVTTAKLPYAAVFTTTGHSDYNQVSFTLIALKIEGEYWYFSTNFIDKADECHKIYMKRWGIETSYRMRNFLAPKTTSKSFELRLAYFLLASLMYNVWVLLRAISPSVSKDDFWSVETLCSFKIALRDSILLFNSAT